MHSYNLRKQSHHTPYHLRSKTTQNEEFEDKPDGRDYYRDIASLRTSWLEICDTDNPNKKWSSREMSYPFYYDNSLHVNFRCKENKNYYFSKPLKEILTNQDRIDEVIGYINKYLNILSTRYKKQIISGIESIKIYPTSWFNIGDICCYFNSSHGQYLVMITSFNDKKKMFPAQARVFPVNNVTHYNQEADGKTLKIEKNGANRNGIKGAVKNGDLHIVMDKEERVSLNGKMAKHIAIARSYAYLFELKSEKYENEKKLNKITVKSAMKTLGTDFKQLLNEKNVGFKRSVYIKSINKRQFKSIYKRGLKQLYSLSGWKEYSLSSTLSLHSSDFVLLFGSALSKSIGFITYGTDEVVLKYDIPKKQLLLIGHITSTDQSNGSQEGLAKHKRERMKNKKKMQKMAKKKKELELKQQKENNV